MSGVPDDSDDSDDSDDTCACQLPRCRNSIRHCPLLSLFAPPACRRANKKGELIVSSQEHRTQHRNREDCAHKVLV